MEQQSQPANQPTETTLPAGQPSATPPPNTSASPTAPQSENLLDDVYDESMEGPRKPIKGARNILFVIGGLQLVGLFTIGHVYDTDRYIYGGAYISLALLFIGLAVWTKWKPYTAICTGLGVYSGLILLSAILEPTTIVKGFIIKCIAFSLMIGSLKTAKEVQTWMELKKSRQ